MGLFERDYRIEQLDAFFVIGQEIELTNYPNKNILPNNEYILAQNNFLHFKKYDYRFHWNNDNSIIEIWIPIQN